jgi:hypothetical protein
MKQEKRLKYRTTWVGNTFGGGPKWVQNFIEGMSVTPDGLVLCCCGWDEGGRECGLYKNGDVIARCEQTHGWGTGGGRLAVASERYVFFAHTQGNEGGGLKGPEYPPKDSIWHGISRYNRQGKLVPFAGGGGRFGAFLNLHERPEKEAGPIVGLAISANGKTLYVADALRRAVRLFDTETLKELSELSAERLGALALDADGALWTLHGQELLRREPDGTWKSKLSLPKPQKPTALAFGTRGRLLVADDGPDQNVKVFLGRKLVGTLGEKGGMWAGAERGKVGPKRFAGLTGIGCDAAGNVYVGCNVTAGGAVLRCFAPGGVPRWELLNLSFVDTADADPASDGLDVFSTGRRYTLTETGWRWRALTTDPWRYPHDMRLHESNHMQCAPQFRRFEGKPFLVVRGMWQSMLCFYRIVGETAIPCVALSQGGPFRAPGGFVPPGQPASGGWLWRDANGNGQMEAGEYLPRVGPDGEFWASNVDEAGDIWQASQDGQIFRWRFGGLDRNGVPRYDPKNVVREKAPAPITTLLRTEYLAESDVMLLSGYTAERPQKGGEWGIVGTEIARYDAWSSNNRTPTWRIALPYQPEGGSPVLAVSFCTAGDYVFAVESRTAHVHVYRLKDGEYVGLIVPGPEVFGETGWVDFRDAIRAVRRRNGEYLIFVEEDAKGKIIVYRWTPEATR